MDYETPLTKRLASSIGEHLETAVDTALALYQKCLTEIKRGILPCFVPVGEKPDSMIINCVMDRLEKEGYNVRIIKKNETMVDEFHNHTYDVQKLYISVSARSSEYFAKL